MFLVNNGQLMVFNQQENFSVNSRNLFLQLTALSDRRFSKGVEEQLLLFSREHEVLARL
jgi:hypothetical protein